MGEGVIERAGGTVVVSSCVADDVRLDRLSGAGLMVDRRRLSFLFGRLLDRSPSSITSCRVVRGLAG